MHYDSQGGDTKVTDHFTIEFNKKLGILLDRPGPRRRKCSHRSFYTEAATDYGLDPEVYEVTRCASCSRVFKRDWRAGKRRVEIKRS
jgi:hypothetical protein